MNDFYIALNDTLETRLLVSSMLVDVEYIKYPSITKPSIEEFKEIYYRTLYHGLYPKKDILPDILSENFRKNLNVEETKKLIKLSNSPGISIHIGDNNENLSDAECILNAKINMNFIKKCFFTDRTTFIYLENMEEESNLNTLKPEFITRLVNETGSKFLLDTAHATIAAHLLNMDLKEYISKLPMDKLYEIHFSGTAIEGNKVFSHIKAREEDYKILEYALSLNNPQIVTIEYGLYDKHYKNGFLNRQEKVSYSKINMNALNEILYMYYRVNKLRKHSQI